MNVTMVYSARKAAANAPDKHAGGETGGMAIFRHGRQTHRKSQLRVTFVTISHWLSLLLLAQELLGKQDLGLSILKLCPVSGTSGLHAAPPTTLCTLTRWQEPCPRINLFHHNCQPEAPSQRRIGELTGIAQHVKNQCGKWHHNIPLWKRVKPDHQRRCCVGINTILFILKQLHVGTTSYIKCVNKIPTYQESA